MQSSTRTGTLPSLHLPLSLSPSPPPPLSYLLFSLHGFFATLPGLCHHNTRCDTTDQCFCSSPPMPPRPIYLCSYPLPLPLTHSPA
ncbi:hypothetical protein K457DRAFT_265103 [Linnemannia elongata AG-77]|uniref:Uncharacterized protein n=1 Tax=Linnemannia elongata AG-77 TaxID=1314771 RepID=A0A197JCZ9_9FUNG|nr:hypothetical protein K457DRAFT_265103 [Linnemannia elongata AG-77]